MNIGAFLSELVPYLLPLVGGMTVAASIALLILSTHRIHGKYTLDHPGSVQTAHHRPTPRVGGLGIYFGLLFVWALLPRGEARTLTGLILVAGAPAWMFGLAEDLTRRVAVLPRLLATMFSGALACLLFGVAVNRVDVPLVDGLLAWWPLAVAFTALAVGGVANAINIIDGFHGLASGTAVIALAALALVAHQTGDSSLSLVAVCLAATVTGFWLLNYPFGKIFLGDGGAYFTGFALAWVAVLLPLRNPEVSPWASLVVCGYPIIEVIYSMLRRSLRRRSLGQPDSQHLHSLLSSQLIKPHAHRYLPSEAHNAVVAPPLWVFSAALALMGFQFRESTPLLILSFLIMTLIYHLVYIRLARRQAIAALQLVSAPAHSDPRR